MPILPGTRLEPWNTCTLVDWKLQRLKLLVETEMVRFGLGFFFWPVDVLKGGWIVKKTTHSADQKTSFIICS